jgi:penicillin-binding protein 2
MTAMVRCSLGMLKIPIMNFRFRNELIRGEMVSDSLVGYVSYPQKDKNGFYYRTEYMGISGAELAFNQQLQGKTESRCLSETHSVKWSVNICLHIPEPGEAVHLSLDVRVSEALFNIIATSTVKAGFRSGAGAIMDIHTGELIALASFPSYDPEVMADGLMQQKLLSTTMINAFLF